MGADTTSPPTCLSSAPVRLRPASALEVTAGETRKVELRLAGYEHRSVVLRAGVAVQVFKLSVEAKAPPR